MKIAQARKRENHQITAAKHLHGGESVAKSVSGRKSRTPRLSESINNGASSGIEGMAQPAIAKENSEEIVMGMAMAWLPSATLWWQSYA